MLRHDDPQSNYYPNTQRPKHTDSLFIKHIPRPIKQNLVPVLQHALGIKRNALCPQQIELFLYIRPRRRLRPLLLLLPHVRLDPAGSALRGLARDHLAAALARKRRALNHLAVVAVDVAGAGDTAVARDARRKDVVAEGVADGARRGAQRAGEAAVGGDAPGGDLLQEVEDAFLKGRKHSGFLGGKDGGGGGGGCFCERGGGALGVGGRVHGDACRHG